MRMLQKRLKPRPCKRSSDVSRYKKYFENCFDLYFQEKICEKGDFGEFSWAKYNGDLHSENHGLRWMTPNEMYKGHFGSYQDKDGYA